MKFSCPISAAIHRNDLQTLTALKQLDEFPYLVNKRIHKSMAYIHLAVAKQRREIADLLLNNVAMLNLLETTTVILPPNTQMTGIGVLLDVADETRRSTHKK